MTTTAEQCNAYQHERTCHDLIILSLPAGLYASQRGSYCIEPIAVLHLIVDGILRMLITPTATTIDDLL